MREILYTVAESEADLLGILKLQQDNLPVAISHAEALREGFVTVEHDLPLLSRMNSPYPHIIARDGDAVIGYTLVMLPDLRRDIPVLVPMFEQIDRCVVDDAPLGDQKYVVMGQVCIAKEYRGLGIFQGLYEEMRKRMAGMFDSIITEISKRNPRSIRAHIKVGFEIIHEYTDDKEDWVIVMWPI